MFNKNVRDKFWGGVPRQQLGWGGRGTRKAEKYWLKLVDKTDPVFRFENLESLIIIVIIHRNITGLAIPHILLIHLRVYCFILHLRKDVYVITMQLHALNSLNTSHGT
jgi:hypothetical protein